VHASCDGVSTNIIINKFMHLSNKNVNGAYNTVNKIIVSVESNNLQSVVPGNFLFQQTYQQEKLDYLNLICKVQSFSFSDQTGLPLMWKSQLSSQGPIPIVGVFC